MPGGIVTENSGIPNGKRVVVTDLTGELSEEFLLVHVILEGLAAVDENHRNFIVKLAAELEVRVNVDFLPDEPSPP
jgi:hypothetical protein